MAAVLKYMPRRPTTVILWCVSPTTMAKLNFPWSTCTRDGSERYKLHAVNYERLLMARAKSNENFQVRAITG